MELNPAKETELAFLFPPQSTVDRGVLENCSLFASFHKQRVYCCPNCNPEGAQTKKAATGAAFFGLGSRVGEGRPSGIFEESVSRSLRLSRSLRWVGPSQPISFGCTPISPTNPLSRRSNKACQPDFRCNYTLNTWTRVYC